MALQNERLDGKINAKVLEPPGPNRLSLPFG